jgi:hypothetical protein
MRVGFHGSSGGKDVFALTPTLSERQKEALALGIAIDGNLG